MLLSLLLGNVYDGDDDGDDDAATAAFVAGSFYGNVKVDIGF